MSGIYFHIPFCKQACYYCDFHFSTNLSRIDDMVDAIKTELDLYNRFFGNKKVSTIYFGGGTPSLLPAQSIFEILEKARTLFTVIPDAEVTLEANPDDLQDIHYVNDLRDAGINRLSIGIQSFNDHVLKQLNRAHDSRMSYKAIENALKSNFGNLNLDLIYSIPFQPDFRQDLNALIELNPSHISAYSLTIEPMTVFGHRHQKGELQETDEDESAEQYEYIIESLHKAGYNHYEVSNFSKPGFESKHNLGYWNYEEYLGIGPGAHTFDGKNRWSNIRNNTIYLKGIQAGTPGKEIIELTNTDRVNEFILTSLRTSQGLNQGRMQELFDYTLAESQIRQLLAFEKEGFLVNENERIYLTTKGKLLADKIAMELFAE